MRKRFTKCRRFFPRSTASKIEIKRLNFEIGFFWIDQDKLRARKLLEARIENLLLQLEQMAGAKPPAHLLTPENAPES